VVDELNVETCSSKCIGNIAEWMRSIASGEDSEDDDSLIRSLQVVDLIHGRES